MKLTHSLKIVLLLAFTSLQMMGMEQEQTKSIFGAIGYYEQGKFEEAAEIFKQYAGKPVPVAEPFCLDLVRKGFLSPFNPVPSHDEVGEKAKNNMYFVAAQHYRTLLKIEGKALMGYLEKHNYAENAPLLYLVGKIFETGTRKFLANNQLAEGFYIHALEKGDLRAVFGLKRVCPKEFNEMKISGLSLLRVYNMLTLMPKLHQDEGHIFAGLSCFFQNSPAAKTFPYFIYPAALFGHPGAQFLKGQSYCQNESQILYWMMQCAEHNNLEALSLCGHMMEQGKGTDINYEKAYGYLKRAAHHPEAKDIEFSNFALIHEQGKGTPVNYQKACKWYGKAYEANSRSGQISKGILGLGEASENPLCYPSHQQFTYDYGKALGLVGEYQKALPLLASVQHFSDDAAYNYAVVLEKLTPEGGDLTEVDNIFQRLASKGHLDAACALVTLVVSDKKIPNDNQSLLTYKSFVENAIEADLSKKKTQGRDEKISAAYNALRNLYFKNEALFSQENVRAIDFSEKAYLFNPLNLQLKLVYAADLKDIGEYQQALEYFLSLQQSGYPVILNSIGSCYDFLAKQAKTPDEASKFVEQALTYYNQEVQDIHSLHRAKAAFNIYCLSLQQRIKPLEDSELVNLLQIAADGGDEDALNDLGAAYMGEWYGLPQDLRVAEKLLRKSIAQGCPSAKINLMNLLNSVQESPETKEEAIQLYNELWTECPKEFKQYLNKLILAVQNALDGSKQEGSGEDEDRGRAQEDSLQEKEREEPSQQESKDDRTTSGSLTPSSSSEEEYVEVDWKKYERKEKVKTPSLQSREEPHQTSVLSKQERQQREEQNRLQKKYERMMRKVETLKGVKQAKYRKIQTLIAQHINAFGGAVKYAKGSGRRVELGGAHSGFHQPHGANGTQIDRGALKNLTTTMQEKNSSK